VQGHEESREHIDADDLRNDYTDTAPLAPTVPLLETLLTVLLNPPPSVTCAANSSSMLCGWWREPPGL
jgi:hypothetical protein